MKVGDVKHGKAKKRILAIILIFIVTVVAIKYVLESNLKGLATAEVRMPDLAALETGEREGSFAVFPVKVKVNVFLQDHVIERIDIIEHRNGQGAAAESIVNEVIAKQSLDVDLVSGATYSSMVILKAIEAALEK